MPFSKQKDGDKWKVVNSDTGDVKGEHDSEGEADAQLAALYANVDDVEKTDIGAGNMFIPITKIDEEKQEVYGWGALEQPDKANEIMDYASSRKHFMDWSDGAQKRSNGLSLGNVREMHQTKAAGKLLSMKADDVNRGFYVAAKIVSKEAWNLVKEGVYTGFSIGGSYLKRWPDPEKAGIMRYTAKPTELSLVDAPCIPGATFQMVKRDTIEYPVFKGGDGKRMIKVDWPEDEDLEKVDAATPVTTPVAGTGDPVKGNLEAVVTVAKMPEPNNTLTLEGNTNLPSTEQLTQALSRTLELQGMVDQMIKTLPATLKKIVRAELDRVIGEEEPIAEKAQDVVKSEIPVKRLITVERK